MSSLPGLTKTLTLPNPQAVTLLLKLGDTSLRPELAAMAETHRAYFMRPEDVNDVIPCLSSWEMTATKLLDLCLEEFDSMSSETKTETINAFYLSKPPSLDVEKYPALSLLASYCDKNGIAENNRYTAYSIALQPLPEFFSPVMSHEKIAKVFNHSLLRPKEKYYDPKSQEGKSIHRRYALFRKNVIIALNQPIIGVFYLMHENNSTEPYREDWPKLTIAMVHKDYQNRGLRLLESWVTFHEKVLALFAQSKSNLTV